MSKDKIDGENDDLKKNFFNSESSGNAAYFPRDKNKIKRKIVIYRYENYS